MEKQEKLLQAILIGQRIALSDKDLVNTTNQAYKVLFEYFIKNNQ